jgi:hypothetical protein
VVRAPRERVRYGVKSAFPVGDVEVKLLELLLPPVMARLHELQSEGIEEGSVVSPDSNRLAEKIMTPLLIGMH